MSEREKRLPPCRHGRIDWCPDCSSPRGRATAAEIDCAPQIGPDAWPEPHVRKMVEAREKEEMA